MTVGFVMLAHEALHRAAQVSRHLASAGCPVMIHVDLKVEESQYRAFAASLARVENVHLARRLRCDWGTWSLVDASRSAAERLIGLRPDISHVVLISGACLPVRPVAELKRYLSRRRNTDFIESVTIGDVPWTQGGLSEERFQFSFPFAWKRHRWLFDRTVEAQRLVRRRRAVPEGLNPHLGSQWWCLTRATLDRILDDPRREELDRYFRSVWIPDESYFQTLVRLYGTEVESRSLTLSKFDFQGKPHLFYDDHLPLLRQAPAFFARKIWPGASRLYRAFLEPGGAAAISDGPVSAARVDQSFAEAVQRRTTGRPGLVMASRFPREGFENGLTASPYAVFHGFGDVFSDFPAWIAKATGTRAHGNLFDPLRVRFAGESRGFAGTLSDSAALRDYDPEALLRNLIWATRGEHQSFLFSPRDSQKICEFVARDRNATVAVVSGAWALPLLRMGKPVAEVRRAAAELQRTEAAFLGLLRQRAAQSRLLVWTLAEFLERPEGPLQDIVDALSGADSHAMPEIPRMLPITGLERFLQELRNAGMNPHLAGEIGGTPGMAPERPASRPARLN